MEMAMHSEMSFGTAENRVGEMPDTMSKFFASHDDFGLMQPNRFHLSY